MRLNDLIWCLLISYDEVHISSFSARSEDLPQLTLTHHSTRYTLINTDQTHTGANADSNSEDLPQITSKTSCYTLMNTDYTQYKTKHRLTQHRFTKTWLYTLMNTDQQHTGPSTTRSKDLPQVTSKTRLYTRWVTRISHIHVHPHHAVRILQTTRHASPEKHDTDGHTSLRTRLKHGTYNTDDHTYVGHVCRKHVTHMTDWGSFSEAHCEDLIQHQSEGSTGNSVINVIYIFNESFTYSHKSSTYSNESFTYSNGSFAHPVMWLWSWSKQTHALSFISIRLWTNVKDGPLVSWLVG